MMGAQSLGLTPLTLPLTQQQPRLVIPNGH